MSNPLMPGSRIFQLQSFFKYELPFRGHQTLKDQNTFKKRLI